MKDKNDKSIKFLCENTNISALTPEYFRIPAAEVDDLVGDLAQYILRKNPHIVKKDKIRKKILEKYKRKPRLILYLLYKVDTIFRSTIGIFLVELDGRIRNNHGIKTKSKCCGKCYVVNQLITHPMHCNNLLSDDDHSVRGFLLLLIPMFLAYGNSVPLAKLYYVLREIGRFDLLNNEDDQVTRLCRYISGSGFSESKLIACGLKLLPLSSLTNYLITLTEWGYIDLHLNIQGNEAAEVHKDYIYFSQGLRLLAEFDREEYLKKMESNISGIRKIIWEKDTNVVKISNNIEDNEQLSQRLIA